MGPIWVEMWARSGENVGKIWDPYGQPTWDPYETGGQTTHGAHMGGNVGKIWENVGNIWDPYGQPAWDPCGTGGQNTHGAQMGCPDGPHIVAQMGPMRGPCLCASWVCSGHKNVFNFSRPRVN